MGPTMDLLVTAAQIIIAAGIVNVWILRFRKSTDFRGGGAQNMKQEFAAYGLSETVMKVVGVLKLSLAALLVVGIWYQSVAAPAAGGMALLMIGALAMHVKVGDPAMKSLPALLMLGLSLFIVLMG